MAAMSSASSVIDRRPFALIAFGVRGKIVTRMGEDLRASFALADRAERRRRTARNCQRNFTKMNRSDEIDSNLSLDERCGANDYAAMLTQPYRLYIERTDKARNMARFYAITIEPDLFGEVCLTRRWGRIGAQGQMKVQHFAREQDAVATFLDLLRQKRRRGYRVPPSRLRH
ncbi:WGR domain-containing protein [Agrobacterium tumefaciens]|uniref:WGR domain-containing protein n=1 Tax=Agrobacterium tumefaciens TaxID=358 RepID=UPI002B1BE3B8|nr:WGR domain-containing protein [Agrobacterium tumefaciens]